jgi:NAD(P)-dependent dehydrogenase (short-subunit alcohol dehydrogenase family)
MTSIKDGWTAKDIPRQDGRVFVVTGANSGLGFSTARELARRGATVLLAVRNAEKGRQAIKRIKDEVPGADVDQRALDLADLDSVRAFAAAVPAVHVLVNNAGVMMPPRTLTKQGFEVQFGANHLAHFALTGLLLPALRRAGASGTDARVVTVSSGLHRGGSIHFDDLDGARSYSPTGFYSQSKFANVLFGLELDRRLRAAGEPIRSLLAHPGYAATNLQMNGPTGAMKFGLRIATALFAQSADMGALDQLYAATDPGAQSGEFIGPRRMREQRGTPTVVQPDPNATDPELARRLWDLSEELTGVRYEFAPAVGTPSGK